jgi:predicted nucleic acid-binding protein
MKYALDASVALKREFPEPDSDKANQIRDDFRNGLIELLAPYSLILEIAPGPTKAERQGKVADAEQLWLDAITTCPQLFPIPALLLRAVQIATKARISFHDCLYVALADREACELITTLDGSCVPSRQSIRSLFRSPRFHDPSRADSAPPSTRCLRHPPQRPVERRQRRD